ncbi:CrcB protein [Streptoalloteichus hindustanus]|uniref:Fluoride-specific ion channel FluC n=1 Tax=Streptoalloteichus hindustanus TaxID=2017 RepID=A0A1M4U1Y4_STRHI|nr:CrcB protein [Streptoalloteichus hindustanus]
MIGVVALGGALGALARYGVGLAAPARPGGFPLATFAINLLGCLLMGVLIVLVTEVWSGHRLARPFLGTGFLGGFTTFSTYAVDGQRLLAAGRVGVALLYLVGTLVGALLAVVAGMALTRAVTGTRFSERAGNGGSR